MRFVFNPFTGQLDIRTTEADELGFDNTGTGLVADNVQDAIVELDGRSVFLRKHALETDFIILAGYFALWVDYMDILDGVELEVQMAGTLEIA